MKVSELIKKLEALKEQNGDNDINLHAKTALVENVEVWYDVMTDTTVISQVL